MPYLTPNSAPGDTICRTVVIPADVNWIAIVNGALSELIYANRFEQFGTATPDEVADVFRTMFYDYLVSECMNGQILVSPEDTAAGFLEDKLLAGLHISLLKSNPGANESLTVASDPAFRTVPFDFTYLTPNPQLIASLPTDAFLSEVQLTIDTPFDGIFIARIGIPGDNEKFMGGTDNHAYLQGLYSSNPDYRCPDTTDVYLYTVNSGVTTGSGHITLIVEE